jgi:hypothetical protein
VAAGLQILETHNVVEKVYFRVILTNVDLPHAYLDSNIGSVPSQMKEKLA